jgi:hypothetical protein
VCASLAVTLSYTGGSYLRFGILSQIVIFRVTYELRLYAIMTVAVSHIRRKATGHSLPSVLSATYQWLRWPEGRPVNSNAVTR